MSADQTEMTAANWLAHEDRGLTAEEAAARWLLELLGLPEHADVGFVTGGTMANFTCLAAARQQVLTDAGWDLDARGLIGAPPVRAPKL